MRRAVILLLVLGVLAGCMESTRRSTASGGALSSGTSLRDQHERLYLVTIAPLKLILDPLVGDRGRVEILLPAGADGHTYDPRPTDMRRAAKANALFWVHPYLDGWATDLGATREVQIIPLLPWSKVRLLPAGTAHSHGDGQRHSNLDADPHFWTDPITVRAVLPRLAAELAKLDPAGAAVYEENAAVFAEELTQLDAQLQQLFEPLHGRAALQFHPSFGYLLERYGLRDAGVVEHFPGKEPSPRYLADTVRRIRAEGVDVVFSEVLLPDKPARALADAADLPMVKLDPACGNPDAEYADYGAWLLYNAELIAASLAHGR